MIANKLGRIEYFVNHGLSKRDQRNPDLSMLVAQASFTLSKIGMEEEVFQHPAASDCAYVFSHRSETEAFVSRILLAGLMAATRSLLGR